MGSLPATAAATLVLIDPEQPARVYAADAAMLYRSNDAGQTWEPASQGLPEPVAALALDPRQPERLYGLTATGTLYGARTAPAVGQHFRARGPMPARPWRAATLGAIVLSAVLTAAALYDAPAFSTSRPATPVPLATPDPGDVALGRQVYLKNCATCHGANAEGAANWLRPDARGNLPPPPHDDTGHTWRHSDEELAGIIRHGMRDIFNTTPELTMPPFKDRLSDEEIAAVIAYLKSLWSGEHRQFQEEQNRRLRMSMATPGATP